MTLPTGYTLRPASPDEAALVREVTLRCWTGSVPANSTAYRETLDQVAEQLRGGGGVLLFAGAEPVGSARFFPVAGPAGDARMWVEIKRVGLLKDLRGHGLAAHMMAALEDAARTMGAVGAQLGVRQDQPRLVQFYEALGYAIARDVQLHTVNPLTPPPFTMRKWFEP